MTAAMTAMSCHKAKAQGGMISSTICWTHGLPPLRVYNCIYICVCICICICNHLQRWHHGSTAPWHVKPNVLFAHRHRRNSSPVGFHVAIHRRWVFQHSPERMSILNVCASCGWRHWFYKWFQISMIATQKYTRVTTKRRKRRKGHSNLKYGRTNGNLNRQNDIKWLSAIGIGGIFQTNPSGSNRWDWCLSLFCSARHS